MSETAISDNTLPTAWRLAYQRDLEVGTDYADPSPERHAAKALAAFILAGLAFLALPGTFLGVWNLIVISEHRAATGASTAWIQAHGHAQLFGWVGSFILGISLYALPKFRGRPLKTFGLVWAAWALWTAGVAWRWWTGISAHEWRLGLVGWAVLEITAYALTQRILVFRDPGKMPKDLGSWLGICGFAALVLNLALCLSLAVQGAGPEFPPSLGSHFSDYRPLGLRCCGGLGIQHAVCDDLSRSSTSGPSGGALARDRSWRARGVLIGTPIPAR
ncbi:MAG TPA: hypothetical protein VGX94_00050 [Terriglobia bacterium]|nr:hypothetical protein [Terriglobia bacterium]